MKSVQLDIEEIGAFEAKTHFSKLLEKVRGGYACYITRRGQRIAELRPAPQPEKRFYLGCDKGKVIISDHFDDPIPGMEDYM